MNLFQTFICCTLPLTVGLVNPSTATAEKSNRLIHEQSPYLLQHAHNPVDWFPWGEEAFSKAKESGKLIFLSSTLLPGSDLKIRVISPGYSEMWSASHPGVTVVPPMGVCRMRNRSCMNEPEIVRRTSSANSSGVW